LPYYACTGNSITRLLPAASFSASAAQQEPLELIAPGLTAKNLCPLVKSSPDIVIAAIASGAVKAYDQGSNAINAFAGAMGAAVGAASSNGCIDEVFEGVNQAIMKGGFKVEVVTGKTLAMGVAKGAASEGGEVLAKATAVVICRGGASASACAKAWNQAIKIDPKNGCAVLVKAYVHARAYCSAGKAYSNVQSTVYKETVGTCQAKGLYDGAGYGSNGYNAPAAGAGYGSNGAPSYTGAPSGSYTPQGPMMFSQGADGQTVTYPDGTVITQGAGGSSYGWGNNGGNGNGWGLGSWGRRWGGNGSGQRGWGWGRKLQGTERWSDRTVTSGDSYDTVGGSYGGIDGTYSGATVAREWGNRRSGVRAGGSSHRSWGWGRKMLQAAAPSEGIGTRLMSAAAAGFQQVAVNARKLQGTEQWGGLNGNSYINNANSFAQATNNGFANGPVVANSNAYANGNGPNSGYGGWGCWWCSSRTTANSAAVATNNGVANGPVVANSAAYADGRR
jgi:hypothetical protein